jgi:superfamily I DNA/RNA helicase
MKEYGTKIALVEFSNLIFGEYEDKYSMDLFADPIKPVSKDFSQFRKILYHEKINLIEKLKIKADTINKKQTIQESSKIFEIEMQKVFNMYSNEELIDYLSDISLQSTSDNENEILNKVVITTAHSAKGLEWNTCFVMNATDGIFPSKKALEAESNEEKSAQIEEEKRLFYVAVSRAKENLYILSNRALNSFISPFKDKAYMDLYQGKNANLY